MTESHAVQYSESAAYVLSRALRGSLYTWAGEPLDREAQGSSGRLTNLEQHAYQQLIKAGALTDHTDGVRITDHGRAIATGWRIKP